MANPTYQSGFYAPGRGTALHPELWRGCVGAWNPGLGNTGLSLRDWSGSQNNGTLTSGPTWGVSEGRQALSFDGVDDFVDFSNVGSPIIPATADFSISMWVYLSAVADQRFFSQYIGTAGNGRLLFRALGGYISVFLGNTGALGSVSVTGTTSVTANTWVHVVATRSGNTFKVWVNGTLDATHTDGSSRSILQTGNTLFSSSNNTSSYNSGVMFFYGGRFDDGRIYNRALSPNEIRTLAQRPGIAYERAPRKFYSLPAAAASRQYRLFRPAILRGA